MLKCIKLVLLHGYWLRICNVSADHTTCHDAALIKLHICLKVFIDPWVWWLIVCQVVKIKGFIHRLISRDLHHPLFKIRWLRDLMTLPLQASLRLHYSCYQSLLLILVTTLEHLKSILVFNSLIKCDLIAPFEGDETTRLKVISRQVHRLSLLMMRSWSVMCS
jgi:hypothetical protein